jgi:hypothetical protein
MRLRSTLHRQLAEMLGVAAIAVVASGCASAQPSAPLAQFKTSVDKTATVVGEYYAGLNDFERHVYLENAYSDPSLEILSVDATGAPTPLTGRVFSPEAIKARTDALALVSVYARRLADLAGTKAPTTFAAKADVLGKNLTRLGQTFTELSGKETRAMPYIAPVSKLIALVGEIAIERARDRALERAVTEAAPLVDRILSLVADDLAATVDPLTRSGQQQQLAQLVHDYNLNRNTWSESRRRRQITDIEEAAQAYGAALLFNPADVIAELLTAHEALVTYVHSRRRVTDLTTLATAVEIFAERVETAATAVRTIQRVQ